MEKTTRMLLVPENMYLAQQRQMIHPSVTQLANLDQQIQSTLINPEIPSDQKAADFNQLNRRYHQLQDQVLNPHSPRPIEKEQPPEELQIPERQILRSVPKRDENKAKLLIDHIKNNQDMFRVSTKNELLDTNGRPIPRSNLVDLVHEVVRNRGSRKLDGITEFITALEETNVPKEALGSRNRLEDLSQKQTPVAGAVATTPVAPSAPNRRKGRKSLQKQLGDNFEDNLLKTPRRRLKYERL